MFAISRSDRLDCHFASISSPAIFPKASVSFVQIQRSNAFQYGYREFTDIKPMRSMYGIYANIGGILMVNVTIYSIHGSVMGKGIQLWSNVSLNHWHSMKHTRWSKEGNSTTILWVKSPKSDGFYCCFKHVVLFFSASTPLSMTYPGSIKRKTILSDTCLLLKSLIYG